MPSVKLGELANALACAIDAMGLLAAPRCFRAAARKTSMAHVKEHLLGLFAGALAAVGNVPSWTGPIDRERLVQLLTSLSDQVRIWSAEEEPSKETMELARRCLAEMGVPDPTVGWDEYERR